MRKPIEDVLGDKEIERLDRIHYNYEYYSGKQHKDSLGRLVRSYDLNRPDGYDYDPARFETNYFKAFIKRKARWQMAGQHGIEVVPKDDEATSIKNAQTYEDLIHKLWKQNLMDSKKLAIARDRMIGGSVHCLLAFNPKDGQLHWVWHKAHEVFPIYSDDGFNTLIGTDIIIPIEDDSEQTFYHVKHFRMNEDYTDCSYEELIYDEQIKVVKTIKPKMSLSIDFVPMVHFNVESTSGEINHFDDLEDMEILTSQLNRMMEDASDSLAFEMFGITVITNAKEGTARQMKIAPGAVVEIQPNVEGISADMKQLEARFEWKEAYKDQYNRIKSALHELSGLPQIVPQELNFGGMNDRALQVLYQDIIQETEEHWLSWEVGFTELFEKSVKYLQARTSHTKFKYDKAEILGIDSELETKMNFILPLPDDRDQLVDLLIKEVDNELDSKRGAMKRLGVVDVEGKLEEIYAEKERALEIETPYNFGSEPEIPQEDEALSDEQRNEVSE